MKFLSVVTLSDKALEDLYLWFKLVTRWNSDKENLLNFRQILWLQKEMIRLDHGARYKLHMKHSLYQNKCGFNKQQRN